MMNYKNLWEAIKEFYFYEYGIPKRYTELVAIMPILEGFAEGYSSRRISKKLKLPEEYIEETIMDYFNTTGWEFDLDISPIAIYNNSNGDFTRYREILLIASVYVDEKFIPLLFRICKQFSNLRKELEEYNDRIS